MFRGCLVALVTPFRNGEVDEAALRNLVDHTIAGGVDGLVPCGTTGESPTLSAEEQLRVIEVVVSQSRGRVPIIAGTGTNSTATTIKYSRAAQVAGAHGLMLVAPYYNRPNQRGLYEHFATVARETAAAIMLYNIPGRTGVEIAPETIAQLHADCPNIQAVKHATGSVEGVSALASISKIAILCGDDPLTLPMMSVGAVGVVSVIGNLLPGPMSFLTRSALEGDWTAARTMHDRLYPLARDLMKLDINPIPIKTALALQGMMTEEFRLPMCPLAPDARTRLQVMLSEHADIAASPVKKAPADLKQGDRQGRITHSVSVPEQSRAHA